MGYIMTYLFMAVLAIVFVGGYSLFERCKAEYKKLDQ
jgi:hypothetical protein